MSSLPVCNFFAFETISRSFVRQRTSDFLNYFASVFQYLFICACLEMNFYGKMQAAVRGGNLDGVQLLLRQGVDKDETDRDGTALWKAACEDHLPIVRFLVEQGADMEKASLRGTTPLIIASEKGRSEVVRYLLEQGADRDKANPNGWTALHWAAFMGHLEIAVLLMSYGADLNARDNDGRLPIDLARTEAMKQAIRDEPRRRMDHGHKRATEQDRHPNAAASASAQQQDDEEEEGEQEQGNKEACIDQVAADAEEARILAEINEDSEPSSDEDN